MTEPMERGCSMHDDNSQLAILEAVRAYLRDASLVDRFVIRVRLQEETFALVEAMAPDGTADPAIGFVRWLHGRWEVLAIGTFFGMASLSAWDVPRSMWPQEALDEDRSAETGSRPARS